MKGAGFVTGWRALARTTADLRYIGLQLLYFNLLWFFTSLPLVTLFPATAALYVVTRDLSYRRDVSLRGFFTALRAHLWMGWKWGLLNLMVAALFALNLVFYRGIAGSPGVLLTAFGYGLLLVWAMVQMYTYPLLLEQSEPRLAWAVRNAIFLLVKYPLYALVHALVATTVVFMSIVVPYFWMLFTTALVLFIYSQAVRILHRLERGEDPFERSSVWDQEERG